jgi:hypothetical protein
MRVHTTPRKLRPARRVLAVATVFVLLQGPSPTALLAGAPSPPPKTKLRGYLTARIDDSTVAILDDRIQLSSGGHVEVRDPSGSKASGFADLRTGQFVEAEGVWLGRHQFSTDKISVDAGFLEKTIHEKAYLQEEPADAPKIVGGAPAELKADGEWLVIGSKTHRQWSPQNATQASEAKRTPGEPSAASSLRYAGHQVQYSGVRREDGRIETDLVELHPPAPPDAYNMPHGLKVTQAKDPQTGIDTLEFKRGTKVDGRLKLFPVRAVQEYVADLGTALIPPGEAGTTRPLEFRFFVVEDSSINAQALPDGTVLVNTALLGAAENEAEIAFALSHEIAHVLQVHYWREVNETRGQRIGLTIAGLAGAYFVGDLSLFLSGLGMAAVVNGHQRELENQADRLGMQTMIERGYDPRQAPQFLRILIDRYGDRSTSKLWSNHDSSVLRGSFLAVQIEREYPQGRFDGARVDTRGFQAMREAMGPVKIE